ncbi:MAG: ABC transporter permease [Variovorax sp.]|nr:MAG: ABC transporter permease [Variovorax sp.]
MRLSAPPLLRFLGRRLLHGFVVLVCIAILDFLLLHMAPGDAAEILAGEAGGGDATYVAQLRAQFGLDQPLYKQLGHYLLRLAQLDLGWSARNNMSVAQLLMSRLPATLLLMVAAITLAVVAGAALGTLAARRVNSPTDNVIAVFSLLSYATPLFWLGLMLIVLFSVTLRWLPTGGMESVGTGLTGWARVTDVAAHAVLPTITLGLFYMAVYTRLVRASVLEVKEMDYVRMARAKGLSPARVTLRHVFRNAMLPMVTMLGVQVGSLLGGAVVVEMVFSWPGLGRLAFDAVLARDLNLLLGIVLASAVLVILINIAVDLLYARLDPRIEVR